MSFKMRDFFCLPETLTQLVPYRRLGDDRPLRLCEPICIPAEGNFNSYLIVFIPVIREIRGQSVFIIL